MRVIFAGGGTGGHLYPGLAIARALVRLRPDVQPFFVGARRGVERDVLPTTEFPHALLDLHPLYRQHFWNNWRTLAGAAKAWRVLGRIAAEERPRAVVGTGGYASGLALAYAAAHGIPYVLQEQNSYPGLTMRLFSRRAREVYLGFPEAARWLKPGARTEIVDAGNPIEPPIEPRPDRAAARAQWKLPSDGRLLLVFGGSQGARAMNVAVDEWIASGRVPPELSILWATGKGTYDQFRERESARVRVVPYIAPMRDAYAAADLALARAGAMGTAELCAWGIPQILVPLPTAAADHQTTNARTLESAGAAVMLPQRDLTVDRLDATVRTLLADDAALARLAAGAAARARPHAAEAIARRILTLTDLQQNRS
jgi:UDP-N-acetylglucosamine--N-acetylmuramyl-(pentapeptide) pyrophosphoryl-undecaprenol N-acetylglucosamine transferase